MVLYNGIEFILSVAVASNILSEFLEVAIHHILYIRAIYPAGTLLYTPFSVLCTNIVHTCTGTYMHTVVLNTLLQSLEGSVRICTCSSTV